MNLIQIIRNRVKKAALLPEVELQPHQQRVVEKLRNEPALLAYHALGSGKTLSSLAIGEQIKGPKAVVVPAALRENYRKEISKFTDQPPGAPDYLINSYNKAIKQGLPEAGLTIFDEAHRMGRPDTKVSKLPLKAHGKVMFLTGTPVRNDPSEFVPLLQVLGQGRNPPKSHKAFREKFIKEVTVAPSWWQSTFHGVKPGVVERLRNRHELRRLLKGRVDYHPMQGEFPRVDEQDIEVTMTPQQTQLYEAFLNEDSGLAYKIKRNLPPSKAESPKLNAFLSAIRQLSNNPMPFDESMKGSGTVHSPKLRRMLGELYKGLDKDPNFKGVVYSNYLQSGILPLAEALERKGIPHAVFTGGLKDKERREIVDSYNSGKAKVLLVSGAGSEGLDLKGTKLMQLMEPHWNQARLDQMIGRAVRHRSHAHLPEAERVVKVQRFFSNPKPGLLQHWGLIDKDTGADRYMINLSNTKQQLISQFLEVLKRSSGEPLEPVSKAAHVKLAARLSELLPKLPRIEKKVTHKTAAAPDYAVGLPDPKRFGDMKQIPPGEVLKWVVQRHLADRAGPHYDVRFGREGNEPSLYSWATRKELPEPGGKIMLFQQPLHRGQYAEFEGELTEGYGKGTVKKHDYGNVIVTKAERDKIQFVVTHKKFPEVYTMIRMSGPPSQGSARTRSTQGGSWLMINTTPMSASKLLGGDPEEVGMSKLKYGVVPADKVDKLFDPNYLIQEKVDGASALYHLMGDRIEALSYRVSKTGRPITYTYKIFGPGGAKLNMPKELRGTIVRGEVYGEREGKAIPMQELGGLLNASISNSLQKQKEQKVQMKNMLFDVVRYGKEPIKPDTLTGEDRMAKLQEIMKHLPATQFRLPETARTPEEQKALYERITSEQHPSTREGIVAWPANKPGRAIKVKPRPERDVWVQNIFPGKGKYDGAAGGFEYSLSPDGPIVGKVGGGFDDPTRKQMMEEAEDWKGRLARISAAERFPSGAYRNPAFLALHHDYPLAKTGDLNKQAAPWERRIAHLISQKGLGVLPPQVRKAIGDEPTRSTIVNKLGPQPIHGEGYAAFRARFAELMIKAKVPQILQDKVWERHLNAYASMVKSRTQPKRFETSSLEHRLKGLQAEKSPEPSMTWSMPESVPLRGNVSRSLPYSGYDPTKTLYKGLQTDEVPIPGGSIFASPHPGIAAEYGNIVMEMARPKGTLLTPHLSHTHKPTRSKLFKDMLDGKIDRSLGSSLSWGNLRDYETALDFDPSLIKRVFIVDSPSLGTLAAQPIGKRVKGTFEPFTGESFLERLNQLIRRRALNHSLAYSGQELFNKQKIPIPVPRLA